MISAVIDTTVLVSAFLRPVPGGAAFELLRRAKQQDFQLFLSDDILEETAGVLLSRGHIRKRYEYPDAAAIEFCQSLADLAVIVPEVPEISVVRDPNDDMILACAVAAGAEYLVSRDKDLLSLGGHEGVKIIAPETFLAVLRESE